MMAVEMYGLKLFKTHACNCNLGTKIEMIKKEKDFIAGTFTPFADDENGMHIIR